jgi:hypothetical protein
MNMHVRNNCKEDEYSHNYLTSKERTISTVMRVSNKDCEKKLATMQAYLTLLVTPIASMLLACV